MRDLCSDFSTLQTKTQELSVRSLNEQVSVTLRILSAVCSLLLINQLHKIQRGSRWNFTFSTVTLMFLTLLGRLEVSLPASVFFWTDMWMHVHSSCLLLLCLSNKLHKKRWCKEISGPVFTPWISTISRCGLTGTVDTYFTYILCNRAEVWHLGGAWLLEVCPDARCPQAELLGQSIQLQTTDSRVLSLLFSLTGLL